MEKNCGCIRSTHKSRILEITIGNTLYFAAKDGINGHELWKTDGTEAGTMMVKDINSGNGDGSPGWLTAVGNTLYFRANDGINGYELWMCKIHTEVTYS